VFAATLSVMLVVTTFSFFVATIPGEALDRQGRSMFGGPVSPAFRPEHAAYGFVLPWLGQRADGTLFGLFERNLNVSDLDLVIDKDVTPGEPTLNLRGRDLRYARLDRTDLHQADMTGADLEGASLAGADLRGVQLHCANLNELILTENRDASRCTNARRANFSRARMKDARLAGIDLRGASLEDADLEAADLSHSNLSGASLYGAHLERADLTGGIWMVGANLATASAQGADLTGAKLQGADLTSAGLQGAVLAHALLQGATLRDADLEGADLYKAKLQGADLRGARLKAASLREAVVWQTRPPERDHLDLADLSDLVVRRPNPDERMDPAVMAKAVESERIQGQVKDALAVLASAEAGAGWSQTADAMAWTGLAAQPAAAVDGYKPRLTAYLADLSCKSRWSNGSVASGVAKRAIGFGYRGDMADLYDRLRSDACPASKTMSRRALRALANAVDQQRGN
jgi:uncharacterized protein YjbI with pentapeptide repeats